MASSEVSIDQLPVVSQIVNGDFIIVQSPNATSKLDFKNFVIGTDNTTFKSAITNVATISGVLFPETVPTQTAGAATNGLPITINGVDYHIMLKAL
tara:strand:- start:202 stop:489 length:288 start_codon:yes stop_codon:yes gene_type:complete